DVVRRRWSEQEDILDALELLGVTALLDQAQTEGVLEQVDAELFEVTQLIDGSGELTAALDGERDDPARRATLLGRLLDGRRPGPSAAARRSSRPVVSRSSPASPPTVAGALSPPSPAPSR